MSDKITYKAIGDRIKSTAKDIIDEIEFPKDSTYDNWEKYQSELVEIQETAFELADETVAYWDWTIYTYKGFQVYDALMSSDQTEAENLYWDVNSGSDLTGASPYELGCAMAQFWLERELANEIEVQCEELIDMAQGELDKF